MTIPATKNMVTISNATDVDDGMDWPLLATSLRLSERLIFGRDKG